MLRYDNKEPTAVSTAEGDKEGSANSDKIIMDDGPSLPKVIAIRSKQNTPDNSSSISCHNQKSDQASRGEDQLQPNRSAEQQMEQAVKDAAKNSSKNKYGGNDSIHSILSFTASNLRHCALVETTGESSEDDEISIDECSGNIREHEKEMEQDEDNHNGDEDNASGEDEFLAGSQDKNDSQNNDEDGGLDTIVREALQLNTVRDFLQNSRANQGSLSSSDYWKGLLVGLFLCQAIFVPLWAAWASGGSLFGSGIGGFLQASVWKSIVGAVAGFGFLVIGVVGFEYDRTLQVELEELRFQVNSQDRQSTPTNTRGRNKNHESRALSLSSTASTPQRQRRGARRQQQCEAQPQRARDVVPGPSTETAPGNSVSETDPSTASGVEYHDVNGNQQLMGHDEVRSKSSIPQDQKREDDPCVDEEGKHSAHCPSSSAMVVTTSSMKKTQDNNHNSNKSLSFSEVLSNSNKSLSFYSGNRGVVVPSDNEERHPAEQNQKDQNESQSLPTKDITFSRSTSFSFPSLEVSQQKTTADFYPDATVLFAHISGFAAWSSERGPDHVFQLLEKLHQRFDEAAERLGITKVDVTSQTYMAVSGVPFPQPDHAVRMIKFAKQIMQSSVNIVSALEGTLGPDTGSLRLRIGCHSGSVCAGILGGRFQIFGNTVGIASSMEASSHRHRIQISEATADLLRKAEKEDWVQKREENLGTKDGREIQTYYVVITNPLSGRSGTSSFRAQRSSTPLPSLRSGPQNTEAASMLRMDDVPKCPKRREVWGESNFMMSLPPMSHSAKKKRLIAWVNKVLGSQLEKVIAQRSSADLNEFEITSVVLDRVAHGSVPSDEYVDVIRPAKKTSHDQRCDRSISIVSGEQSVADLSSKVANQLRAVVTKIAGLYKEDNPYHGFEHATHTTMSVQKLLNRCIAQDDDFDDVGPEYSQASRSLSSKSTARDYMSDIALDALSQFAVLWSALVHDCGHEGLSSRQLTRLKPKLSETYAHDSVAEQNSIDLAWEILFDPEYVDLQKCLFSNESELLRFRQIMVNSVLATDLSNGKRQALRNKRWDRAFHFENDDGTTLDSSRNADLKATAVLECLVQASDNSHAMQHWKVYQKWSERFFREKCIAYDAGRSFCNPQETWYQEELAYLDKYAIPLAKQLAEAGVFGVASNECLNHALENRKEWSRRGEELVQEMYQRYHKRKDMEVGGFTNEEMNNFSAKDLQYIMNKLVEKGRNNGSNEVDEEKGQLDAAQAWLDALEIYERCPASMEMSDRSIIFPIYSGVYTWIKGERIPQDQDGNFEVNLARKFVQESKLHMDPIHHTRALAMLAEVYGRRGKYEQSLVEFKKLAEIYSCEAHSTAIAAVYGTDRSSHAFSFSALWHEQLGNSEEAAAACEYVIQDLLPMMDPTNTLGNFELLLNVLRVMKPKGQERRMHTLLNQYIILPFRKYHGPNGFTPCIKVFKPLLWLLDICADPGNFKELDAAVEWLMVEENGIIEDFVDSIYAKAGWAPHDMVAELCLRLALADGDPERQSVLVRKGLLLARSTERKIKDTDGNVLLPIANVMHEPVLNALEEIARQLGLGCDAALLEATGKQLNVNLPRSYLRNPEDHASTG